jgi:TolB-like protein
LRTIAGQTIEQSPKRTRRKRTGRWLIASAVCAAVLLFGWFLLVANHGLFFSQRSVDLVPTEKSIAVLPFENISANKDDAYFADGVQDEILNNLAKIAQLKVISRTSVMQYRADTRRDLRQIANALGVANVLEGAVRRNGNRVRVSTEVIDARNDSTIWADSYDRDLTDIFAIQSEVSQAIARKLTATLSPQEKARIEAKPTDNLEAYDSYLRAKQLIIRANLSYNQGPAVQAQLREAVELLEHSVQLDPEFALAYCASTQAHDFIYFYFDRSPEERALGDAAINNALNLQPQLPEVRLAYAFHLFVSYRDYERARVQVEIVRRDSPNNVDAIILAARMDRRQGHWKEAIQGFNEAIERDPGNRESIRELAITFAWLRQFDAAVSSFDQLVRLFPDIEIFKVYKAYLVTYMKTGDTSALSSAIAGFPPSSVDTEILAFRIIVALADRNWKLANEVIQVMTGGYDDGYFAYGNVPVPVGCYSILIARLEGERTGTNSSFAATRQNLDKKVQRMQGDAPLLSQLAVVDALLNQKEIAISEAKQAVEMLPVSKDAVDGPVLLINLAVVYAWTDEIDLAFQTLSSLTKTPDGIYYGELKRDPYWDPLRKDQRFDKLLSELAPQD